MRADLLNCPPVAIAKTLAGGAGIVDLWYWFYEPDLTDALVETGVSWITEDELERYRRFRFERDRRLFLATRVLVRDLLSRYAVVAPADWRFVADRAGKPHVSGPALTPALHFNLANTSGLVICGVSVAHDALGVDVERVGRVVDYISLAGRFFAAAETEDLRTLPPERQPQRFFEYWTLKESYIKAREKGLSIPLDTFSFRFSGDRHVAIAIDRDQADPPSRWRFWQFSLAPDYLAALCAERIGRDAPRLVLKKIVPLVSEHDLDSQNLRTSD